MIARRLEHAAFAVGSSDAREALYALNRTQRHIYGGYKAAQIVAARPADGPAHPLAARVVPDRRIAAVAARRLRNKAARRSRRLNSHGR